MSRSFRRVLATLFAVGLLLAACGDDDATPADPGGDPAATCPVGEPDCNDTADDNGDPFATCPVGEPDCNDTPNGDEAPVLEDDGGSDEPAGEPTEG